MSKKNVSDGFQFKTFYVRHSQCAQKIGTDGVLLGAWAHIPEEAVHILDIGCGSGLLSLMAAQRSIAQIDAVEIDEQAAHQAIDNVELNHLSHRIVVMNMDARKIKYAKKYHAILINPPFYKEHLYSPSQQRAVARSSDFFPLEEIFKIVVHCLHLEGSFNIILPYKSWEEAQYYAAIHNLYIRRQLFVKTKINKPFFRVLLTLGFKHDSLQSDEICLMGNDGSLTAAYKNLTKEFYL